MPLTNEQLNRPASVRNLQTVVTALRADLANVPSYTLEQATTPTAGYSTTYEFKKDGTVIGRINLALDYFCKGVSAVQTAQEGDDAVTNGGIAVGTRYVDFTVGVRGDDTNDSHLYLNLADLAPRLELAPEGGLKFDADGKLALDFATDADIAALLADTAQGA